MDTKQIKLKLRNTVNKITGKQPLIDEYNKVLAILCQISDKVPTGTPEKEYLRERLDIITGYTVTTNNGVIHVKDYNPWKGSKETTRRKIAQLHDTLYLLQRAR